LLTVILNTFASLSIASGAIKHGMTVL